MKSMAKKNIIWSVAGSDSSAGAGIQADLKTCHYFAVHCCCIITTLTAQNTSGVLSSMSTDEMVFANQIKACQTEFLPSVVKSGVIASVEQVEILAQFLQQHPKVFYICDPVMVATSSAILCTDKTRQAIKTKLLPRADLITPNRQEAEILLEQKIDYWSNDKIAKYLLNTFNPKSVLVTGGDDHFTEAVDYWVHQSQEELTLSVAKINNNQKPYHGTGCTLSAAIASAIAKGNSIQNALILAKNYVTQAIQASYLSGVFSNILNHQVSAKRFRLPKIKHNGLSDHSKCVFKRNNHPMGFYPIVDSSLWVERLAQWGVRTIQLRIKTDNQVSLTVEIKKAVEVAKKYHLQLFINDYWELAIQYGAYGVHLGQEDLESANLKLIAENGLCLGLSTHDYYELSRALNIQPTYIALGSIYHTTSKKMRFKPQGLEQLRIWKKLVGNIPLVAIGGIGYAHMQDIYQQGADGIAVIGYVLKADDPYYNTQRALAIFNEYV